MESAIPAPRGGAPGRRLALAVPLVAAVCWAGTAWAQPGFPSIPLWAHPGVRRVAGSDTSVVVPRPRTVTLRWKRDRLAEARPDFGGYRIYRAVGARDTSQLVLLRRFSVQVGDDIMWGFSKVDSNDVGEDASVALDGLNRAHMSYYNGRYRDDLYYAREVGGQWTVEPVDVAGAVGRFTSLKLDAAGSAHIAYYDATTRDLRYATGQSGAWTIEVVDTTGDVGQFASLALDGNGRPLVAYHSATDTILHLRRRIAPGAWAFEFDYPAEAGYGSVVTAPGLDHCVSLASKTNRWLAVGCLAGASFTYETVDATVDLGRGGRSSLAADNSGNLHVAYFDSRRGDLRYANRSGGVWTTETVDSLGTVGRFPSLALDALGAPHISYYDDTDQTLRYARKSGGGWAIEAVDASGLVTGGTSLALDGLGAPAIGYHVASLGLRHARKLGAGWSLQTVHPPDVFFASGGAVASDSIVQFLDPDSAGNFQKVCRRVDRFDRCLSIGDSVYKLISPPGPHDGYPLYYTITYEARNTIDNNYEDLFVPDTLDAPGLTQAERYARCDTVGRPGTCPNRNLKSTSLMTQAVIATGGSTADLERVGVVPNPYRRAEPWEPPGASEVHFINLPSRATIRIYTASGDLVRVLEHDDTVLDFERWNLKNADGRDVASGIYIYRVEAGTFSFQDRFVVVR